MTDVLSIHAKPNTTSFIVLDQNGDYFQKCMSMPRLWWDYEVKTLNLLCPMESSHYNPFKYMQDGKDASMAAKYLMHYTAWPDDKNDKIDDTCVTAEGLAMESILTGFISDSRIYQKTFNALLSTVSEDKTLNSLAAKGQELLPKEDRALLMRFTETEMRDAAISCTSRLFTYDWDDILAMTSCDIVCLDELTRKDTIIYIIGPTEDAGYLKFFSAMLITQVLQYTFMRDGCTTGFYNYADIFGNTPKTAY